MTSTTPDDESLVEEVELTYEVPIPKLASVFRGFGRPLGTLDVLGRTLRLRSSTRRAALYMLLENAEADASDRMIFWAGGSDHINATYSLKRWRIEDGRPRKYESAKPLKMSMEQAARQLREDGREIWSSFIKEKWTLRYTGVQGVKIRLDQIIPTSPSSPLIRREPFWDIEFELAARNGAANAPVLEATCKLFLETFELGSLRPIESRKAVRARLFPSAAPPSSASALDTYVRAALRGRRKGMRYIERSLMRHG